MTLYEKLSLIQREMKAPKNLYNSYGGYKYRNAEGILEAFKPFEEKYNVCLLIADSVEECGGRVYIKATANLFDLESGAEVTAAAYAREAVTKKGMDDSQITGTASSYARKYALNGLFLLDDTKDADTDENRREREARQEKEKTGKQTIDKTKAVALAKLITGKGGKVEDILAEFSIERLSELTEEQNYEIVKRFQ